MKLVDLHGTYVALESNIKGVESNFHITLMYSLKRINPTLVHEILSDLEFPMFVELGQLKILDVHNSDGTISSTNGMLVRECNDPKLHEIHNRLKSIGLVHSYEKYTPHVSLKEVLLNYEPSRVDSVSLELVRLIVEPIRTNAR